MRVYIYDVEDLICNIYIMITDTQLDHLARLASLHISTEDKADLVHTFKSIV